MNKEIVNHFQYKWWVYLLAIVLIIVCWFSIFDILAEPKSNERLYITFVGNSFDNTKLQEDLPTVLKDLTSQNIKKIGVEIIDEENVVKRDSLLVTRAMGTTDIFIWEGDLADNLDDRYAVLNDSDISSLLGDVEYHKIDGKAYAILLNATQNNFSKYYSGDKQCWLLVSANSVNFGGANGNGNESNDSALQAVKYLLENYV